MVKSNDLTTFEREPMFLKNFSDTLEKGALRWYMHLPLESFSNFKELVDMFIKAYIGAQMIVKRKDDIFDVKQGYLEPIKDFLEHF